jgi:hypothetical protein
MAKKFILESHPDDWTTFKEWLEQDFLKRHGGYNIRHQEYWWKQVEKRHKDIRELIGGIRIEKEIQLKTQQNLVREEDAKPFVDEILSILPDYLIGYNFTKDVFLKPQIVEGTHKATKTAKHVRAYADQALRYTEQSSVVLKRLDKALSQLGELWAKARTSDTKLHITLSTSPRAFVLLGHYGPDSDSCFRNGSDKDFHKWMLGQTDNSFVVTIAAFDQEKQKSKNVARCFGFLKADAVHIFNHYFSPSFLEGDAIESLKLFFSQLWKTEVSFFENISKLLGIYQNPYGRWSFFKGKKDTVQPDVIVGETQNISKFECPICAYAHPHDLAWREIDDNLVCHNCVKKAHTCEISHCLTFKELSSVITADGITKFVHPDVAAIYTQCSNCTNRAENLVSVNDELICKECVECCCSFCDHCNQYVSDDEMNDIGTRDICQTCMSRGISPFDEDELYVMYTIQE